MRTARTLLLLASLLVGGAGCVVEGTLDSAGQGRLELRYRMLSIANFEAMKTVLASPDVTMTDASMTPDKHATFAVAVKDVRALASAPAFANMRVALVDEVDGLRTLSVALKNISATLPAPYFEYIGRDLRITLTLPGEIVRSNATSVNGSKATWVWPMAEIGPQAPPTISVTFRPAAS